jgi:hypothetical protein
MCLPSILKHPGKIQKNVNGEFPQFNWKVSPWTFISCWPPPWNWRVKQKSNRQFVDVKLSRTFFPTFDKKSSFNHRNGLKKRIPAQHEWKVETFMSASDRCSGNGTSWRNFDASISSCPEDKQNTTKSYTTFVFANWIRCHDFLDFAFPTEANKFVICSHIRVKFVIPHRAHLDFN